MPHKISRGYRLVLVAVRLFREWVQKTLTMRTSPCWSTKSTRYSQLCFLSSAFHKQSPESTIKHFFYFFFFSSLSALWLPCQIYIEQVYTYTSLMYTPVHHHNSARRGVPSKSFSTPTTTTTQNGRSRGRSRPDGGQNVGIDAAYLCGRDAFRFHRLFHIIQTSQTP